MASTFPDLYLSLREIRTRLEVKATGANGRQEGGRKVTKFADPTALVVLTWCLGDHTTSLGLR